MGLSNKKGDFGEVMVIADLMKRGYQVSVPYGHDTLYDLVVDRNGKLERIQVKYTKSDGYVIKVRLVHDAKNKNGCKKYSGTEIDWIAVFDEYTNKCYYIPSEKIGSGEKSAIRLRLIETKNRQEKNVNLASLYEEI